MAWLKHRRVSTRAVHTVRHSVDGKELLWTVKSKWMSVPRRHPFIAFWIVVQHSSTIWNHTLSRQTTLQTIMMTRHVVVLWLSATLLLLHGGPSPLVAAFCPEFRGDGRLFLDTADTSEWEELLPTGIFHGVTTNPLLLERAGQPCTIGNLHTMAAKALQMTDEFMCQAWGSTSEDMFSCGMELSKPARDRIVIKVPVTMEGVKAASMLIQAGVRICLTACYDHKQALIAASVGAEYIAPYLGRMTEAGKDGSEECFRMQEVAEGMQSEVRILVASIRDAQTMVDLAARGMETFTFSPAVARELFVEPLTTEAAAAFEEAAKNNS